MNDEQAKQYLVDLLNSNDKKELATVLFEMCMLSKELNSKIFVLQERITRLEDR